MENFLWHEEEEGEEHASWSQNQTQVLFPWIPSPHHPAAAGLQFHCYPSSAWAAKASFEDRGGSSGSRSHSEAEKRRRDRINGQLATLRKLIPKSEKMDKAALLGQVVEHVKDLKQKAKEISKLSTMPSEIDEVTIDQFNNKETSAAGHYIYIKASVCCEDRPELFAELNCALKGLRLTILEADITSLGGRIKAIFALCAKNEIGENYCFGTLKQSLKSALGRIVISSATSNFRARSKRQRFFCPSH